MQSIGLKWTHSPVIQAVANAPTSSARAIHDLWQKRRTGDSNKLRRSDTPVFPPGSATMEASIQQERRWLSRGEALGRSDFAPADRRGFMGS